MIENSNYSSLGQKINRTSLKTTEFDTILELKNILLDVEEKNWHNISQENILRAFCNDLKKLLDKDSIFEMTENIFNIENSLDNLNSEIGTEFIIPNMEDFYKKLSPILLRSLWESSKVDGDQDDLIHGWKESLRISIEEEFYVWQEKMI